MNSLNIVLQRPHSGEGHAEPILPVALAIWCVAMAVQHAGPRRPRRSGTGSTRPNRPGGARRFSEDKCSACHAEDLTGADGPALKGEPFTLLWEGRIARTDCSSVSGGCLPARRPGARGISRCPRVHPSGERVSRGRARALHRRGVAGGDRHRAETVIVEGEQSNAKARVG